MLARLDMNSDQSVREQLLEILHANASRLVDLFREWDEDGDGQVSRAEFRRAFAALGGDVPRGELNAIFDSLDADGSGFVEYDELAAALELEAETKSTARGNSEEFDAHEQLVRAAGSPELSSLLARPPPPRVSTEPGDVSPQRGGKVSPRLGAMEPPGPLHPLPDLTRPAGHARVGGYAAMHISKSKVLSSTTRYAPLKVHPDCLADPQLCAITQGGTCLPKAGVRMSGTKADVTIDPMPARPGAPFQQYLDSMNEYREYLVHEATVRALEPRGFDSDLDHASAAGLGPWSVSPE